MIDVTTLLTKEDVDKAGSIKELFTFFDGTLKKGQEHGYKKFANKNQANEIVWATLCEMRGETPDEVAAETSNSDRYCSRKIARITQKVCHKIQSEIGKKDCVQTNPETKEDQPCEFLDEKIKLKTAKEKKKAERKPSYQDKIKVVLNEFGWATRETLMEATGADAKNLSVAVSILKNPKRTKEPMAVDYVRGNQVYFAVGHPKASERPEPPVVEKKPTAAAEAEASNPENVETTDASLPDNAEVSTKSETSE